ncbi:MAG: glycine zipper 2TM domain-containing protein [Rhodocyclales bacterium]|nr:glycine zipper 2TM domain-containing protein [Rhodocyclales bacterium]
MNRHWHKPLILAVALAVGAPLPTASWADPPSHAPAHGWRKKHDPYYQGYTGKQWGNDYGILSGRCNVEAAGAAIGGVIGGAIGSQVGQGDGRTVAIIVGTVLGAVVGAKAARELSGADQACFGHALELAKDRQRVGWRSPESGVDYAVTPLRTYQRDGRQCRDYEFASGRDVARQTACAMGAGEWRRY